MAECSEAELAANEPKSGEGKKVKGTRRVFYIVNEGNSCALIKLNIQKFEKELVQL